MTIDTYAGAQAVGICWLYHFRGSIKPPLWDGLHPGRCEWCDFPQDAKLVALQRYNALGSSERQRRAWFSLPGTERLRLIHEAQGR